MPQLLWIFLVAGTVLGQSGFTFNSTELNVEVGIVQVLTGDFNSDHNADVVLLSTQNITVLLGNGDGTFQSPIQIPAPGYQALVAGDFNNDGKTDIVAFGYVPGPVALQTFVDTFLGNGDGTFAVALRSPVSYFPSPPYGPIPQVGDFDHNGVLDVVDLGSIILGTGSGTFVSATGLDLSPCFLGGPNEIVDSATADFTGSGLPDVALLYGVSFENPGVITSAATTVACINSPNGMFLNDGKIYGSEVFSRYAVTTGDFNGDGRQDVLVLADLQAPGSSPSAFGDSVLFGKGNGSFQSPVAGSNLYFSRPVVIDFNGDGEADLVQIGGIGLSVFISNGDGTFADAADISSGQTPVSVAVADFNNDGLPDIIATGSTLTSVFINTTSGIRSIVNAASLAPNQPVAPGSLVAIFGAAIGPAAGMSGIGTDGVAGDSVGGVSVTFNGIPAPLTYVSARQVNAQVPWETTGAAHVVVSVTDGSTSSFLIQTAPIAPGVFATATGQAFAFNPDGSIAGPSGTILGLPSHPAAAGDTLTVLANGLGPVSPAIPDGQPSGELRNAGSTPVFIGGVACDVTFAGLSTIAVGVNQLRVIVPANVHGIVPLVINAGGIITTSAVTIAIQ